MGYVTSNKRLGYPEPGIFWTNYCYCEVGDFFGTNFADNSGSCQRIPTDFSWGVGVSRATKFVRFSCWSGSRSGSRNLKRNFYHCGMAATVRILWDQLPRRRFEISEWFLFNIISMEGGPLLSISGDSIDVKNSCRESLYPFGHMYAGNWKKVAWFAWISIVATKMYKITSFAQRRNISVRRSQEDYKFAGKVDLR